MRARLFCLALAIGLVPAAAFAQDGLRSASLPERRLGPTTSRPLSPTTGRPLLEDVFLARPDTYRPDRHRPFPPFVYGGVGPAWFYPEVQPIIVVIPREAFEPAPVAPPPVPPAPVDPPAAYVPGPPGRPQTFYVIPGCYAGDRRPEPESLKPGCSISRLRVVPPRP
jgi:hypothetical protein